MGVIVVGYDHSDGSKLALRTAQELATQFSDRLVIAYGYGASPRTGEELRAHNEALEELGREATDEGLANAREAGVDAEVALVADRPAAALLSLAERHDARFIVVGSYGESPLRSAILGSTPHKLLHLSERPVVVVPA